MFRFHIAAAAVLAAVFLTSCQPAATPPASAATPASAAKASPSEGDHDHKPGAHGGTLVSIGKDNYHAEAVFEQGGKVRLYMLGADESKVVEIESQTLPAFAKAVGELESMPFEFKAQPQSGDSEGKTSQFAGDLPMALAGKRVAVTIPSLRIGSDRFRVAFFSSENEAAMPKKLGSEEERKVFLTPGGAYTAADIQANGSTVPVEKYRGIRAEHDDNPKPGEKICPISKTKANPKFTWVIGGKTYQFCCVPCIEEFVILAKEKPSEIKDPKDYVK